MSMPTKKNPIGKGLLLFNNILNIITISAVPTVGFIHIQTHAIAFDCFAAFTVHWKGEFC